jgi:hypothetical protein
MFCGPFSADRSEMKRVFRYSNGKLYVNIGDISIAIYSKKVAALSGIEIGNTKMAWLITGEMYPDFITIGILGENPGEIITFSLHISQVVLVH